MPFKVLALGNPLLDIQGSGDEAILKKYGLEADNAILANETHLPLYKEISEKPEVVYVAGGAAQNTARGIQQFLPENSTVYIGCVSNDEYSEKMKAAALQDGLTTNYMISTEAPTGTCAVLISGHHRSLVANLGAAETLKVDFVRQAENWKLVEDASYYYVGGFCLSHEGGYRSALAISKHAAENNKTFTINLSAPFISEFFKARLDDVLLNTDILFGNESEARTYAKAAGWGTEDVEVIAGKLAQLPKSNSRGRIVVITQGAERTVVAHDSKISTYDIIKVADKDIVDTNGAGDAFCGGFMGSFAGDVHDIEKCVQTGHILANYVIKQTGPSYAGFDKSTAL